MRTFRFALVPLAASLAGCAHDECATHRASVDADSRTQTAHFERGVLLESRGRVVDAVVEYAASVDAGAEDDVGDAARALDRLLRSDAAVPADLRRRAWDAVVAKHPTDPRYANAAANWYADVARDKATAMRYHVAAAKATPDVDESPYDGENAPGR